MAALQRLGKHAERQPEAHAALRDDETKRRAAEQGRQSGRAVPAVGERGHELGHDGLRVLQLRVRRRPVAGPLRGLATFDVQQQPVVEHRDQPLGSRGQDRVLTVALLGSQGGVHRVSPLGDLGRAASCEPR